MSRRKNKFFFLFILLFVFSGCTEYVKVDGIERADVEKTTYSAIVNGQQKELSIYDHLETINGTDFVVPNQYVKYGSNKFQITVYEKIEDFQGKKYLIPLETKVYYVDNEGVTLVFPQKLIFIDASGQKHNATIY